MRLPFRKDDRDVANFDLSISDLMAALVLIFILLLSTQFLEIKKQSSMASEYRERQQALITALQAEFENDLSEWSAEIDEKTLVIRFKNEDPNGEQIGFDPNSSELKERFKRILDDFFPRYIAVLTKPTFIDQIDEVRIEGHTANPEGQFSNRPGYSASITQSQERANNVLFYVLDQFEGEKADGIDTLDWVRTHIAASGFAYAKPILVLGKENWKESRRVEFKIRTNYDEVIQKLIEVSGGNVYENP